jgi:hypothetical protein
MYEWIGFGLVLILGIAFFLGPWIRGISHQFRMLLVVAVLSRALGALIRYWVLFHLYNGVGDATGYYTAGIIYSKSIYGLDFSFLWNGEWFARRWWGTQFLRTTSGFVVAVIGPSMRGEFLFFSLLSIVGLYLLVRSFQHSFPSVPMERYAKWLILCPSLLYWPSAVGKEGLSLLAIGFVVYGYTRPGSRQWMMLIAGLLIAFCVRPHLAGVLAFSIAFAHWTMVTRRSPSKFILEGMAILMLGAVIGYSALTAFGLDDADFEEVQVFIDSHSVKMGGSVMDAPSGGLSKIPMAFVNVLFRPFLWEASGAGFFSALEVLVFWAIVWKRRARVLMSLKAWRQSELLRFGVAFSFLYALMIGMVIVNLGILARQRTLMIPFMLLWLEAMPEEPAVLGNHPETPVALSRRRTRAREIEPDPA